MMPTRWPLSPVYEGATCSSPEAAFATTPTASHPHNPQAAAAAISIDNSQTNPGRRLPELAIAMFL
jgi:hypothetical protein